MMNEINSNDGTTTTTTTTTTTSNIQKLEEYNPYKLSFAVNAALRNPLNNVTTNAHKLTPNGNGKLNVGRMNLRNWLGKTFRVVITDGRVLVGFFNCTDKDANIVLSMCAEYLVEGKDARILGNVMIPGNHIVSISVDLPKTTATTTPQIQRPDNLKNDYRQQQKIELENIRATAAAAIAAATAAVAAAADK